MRRLFGTGLAALFLMILVCACGREETGVGNMEIPQTGWTEAVPAEYTQVSDEQGSVVRFDYESEDYVRDGSVITKTAYVYTPYGYDENDSETRYNILYLMHGWGGHAGEYFEFTETKNMFDNLIANGDIPPIIIVSATFYNENSSTDFGSSIEEFRAFYQDFEEHLMPAVEERFHTYAKSASAEDLKASRNHRAFGGFSLGSVTTWLQFCYDYDYIRGKVVIPGSKNPDHIRDNFDIFDFVLSNEDMAQIAKVNKNKRYYTATPDMLAAYATMELGPDL